MVLNGRYKLEYVLDKVVTDIVVNVELKQNEGQLNLKQNIWHAVATVDGKPYENEELDYCVNAKLMAESIGIKLRDEVKSKAKIEGKSFRIKKEEIK